MKDVSCGIILVLSLCIGPCLADTAQEPRQAVQSTAPAATSGPPEDPKSVPSKPQGAAPAISDSSAAQFICAVFSAWERGIGWGNAHPKLAGVVLWVTGFSFLWGLLLAIYPLALLASLRFSASVSEFAVRRARTEVPCA